MVKTTVLEPQFHSDVPDRNFIQSKRLICIVLNISENWSSKGQKPSLPHDQIWAKLQFFHQFYPFDRKSSDSTFFWCLTLVMFHFHPAGACTVPEHLHGEFFSIDKGEPLNTRVSAQGLVNEEFEDARCVEYVPINGSVDALGRFDVRIMFSDE